MSNVAERSDPPSHSDSEHVLVGRVVGLWGLKGDLKIQVLTDFPERFSPGSSLLINGERATVERSRPSKGGLLVKLDLAADRTQAEGLRGRDLTVPIDEVSQLPPGSYYYFQIIGMSAWNEEGEQLGEVQEILPGGGTEVYVIKRTDGHAILLPARSDVILDVNIDESRMTVRVPKGLG